MATNISLPSQSAVLNTGKNPKYLNPAIIVGALLVPYNWVVPFNAYDTADVAIDAVMTKVQRGLIAADPKERIRYIGPFESVENQNEAVKVQTLGYGKKVTTDRAKKYDMFTFDEGGLQYFRYVLSYRDQIRQFKLIYFDANGVLYTAPDIGTPLDGVTLNGVQVLGAKGMELSRLYPNDWVAPTQDTEAIYGIEIGLKNPLEWNENLLTIETGVDMLALCEELSVQGVDFTFVEVIDGGEVNFTMRTALHKIELADELPDIIDTTSFVAKNEATGNAIPIDSVSYDTVTKVVTVMLDGADPDYVEGEIATIALADTVTLGAAGFKYFESNKMRFTMSAP